MELLKHSPPSPPLSPSPPRPLPWPPPPWPPTQWPPPTWPTLSSWQIFSQPHFCKPPFSQTPPSRPPLPSTWQGSSSRLDKCLCSGPQFLSDGLHEGSYTTSVQLPWDFPDNVIWNIWIVTCAANIYLANSNGPLYALITWAAAPKWNNKGSCITSLFKCQTILYSSNGSLWLRLICSSYSWPTMQLSENK